MSEPVMCPKCGQSYPEYPADGKCPQCGGEMPVVESATPSGIEEELARFGEVRRICRRCGKPYPEGALSCPVCDVAEEVVVRRAIPPWVKLVAVLVFAAVAGFVTFKYMKDWGRERRINWVNRELTEAQKAAKEDRIGAAVRSIEAAREYLQDFDEGDEVAATLRTKITATRNELRVVIKNKLQEMINNDLVGEAESFYGRELKPIDIDGSLRDLVDKAVANRVVMRKCRTDLKNARRLYDGGHMVEALDEITTLRQYAQQNVQGDALADLRNEIQTLQTQWVQEAYDKGMTLLDEGKLSEASQWFQVGEKNVWASEVTLKRKLVRVRAQITEKKVVGVILKTGTVRVVKADEVRTELSSQLKRKLSDEGFLMLTVTGPSDPSAAEIDRIVTADYSEGTSREFQSPSGTEKAMGTKINCRLSIIPARGGEAIWKETVSAETGVVGASREGFNDGTLRMSAFNTFRRALDSVLIPSRHLIP